MEPGTQQLLLQQTETNSGLKCSIGLFPADKRSCIYHRTWMGTHPISPPKRYHCSKLLSLKMVRKLPNFGRLRIYVSNSPVGGQIVPAFSTPAPLCEQFSQCKSAMAQRFLQVFSYWKELPWRLCAIATNLFYISDDSEVESTYIEASKLFASEALEMWKNITSSGVRGQAGGQGHGHFQMARLFLDPTFPGNLSAYVVYWASSSDRVMPSALSKELMKYCSALTCMQVLEAQHHYVNQRMSFGRAALPASTCAWLRRRTNADVFDIRFKQNLGEYIGKLPSLLPSSCSSRAETFHMHRK